MCEHWRQTIDQQGVSEESRELHIGEESMRFERDHNVLMQNI